MQKNEEAKKDEEVKKQEEEKKAASATNESSTTAATAATQVTVAKTGTPPKEKKGQTKDSLGQSAGLGVSRHIDGSLKYLDVQPLMYVKNFSKSKVLDRWAIRF